MGRAGCGGKYVAYYFRQVDHGQVARFVEFNDGTLLGEYIERTNHWLQLAVAIERCQAEGAVLVVCHLGRLVRNPRFLALLQASKLDFACLDNQTCNRFTVHILMATAEEESAKISERTRRTLREAVEKKGLKLGSNRPGHWEGREHLRGTRQAIAASARMRRVRTQQSYEFLLPTMKEMRLAGRTMVEIAEWLNGQGHRTTAGFPFKETSVWRILKRYLGRDYLGKVKDRGGHPQLIRAMEKAQ